MKHHTKLAIVILTISLCALQFTALPCSAQSVPIKHVAIIIQENRSLDTLFGQFAGVNGATSGDYLGTTVSLKDALLISQPRPAVGGCFRIGDPGPVSDHLALCEGWTGGTRSVRILLTAGVRGKCVQPCSFDFSRCSGKQSDGCVRFQPGTTASAHSEPEAMSRFSVVVSRRIGV